MNRVRAISLWAPWGYAIFNLGKDVENRSRPLDHVGPLLIHQSATRFDTNGCHAIEGIVGHKIPASRHDYAMGKLIGYVEMTGCKRYRPGQSRDEYSRWAQNGLYHYHLKNPVAFENPITIAGSQGVFYVPYNVLPAAHLRNIRELMAKYKIMEGKYYDRS